MRLSIITVNLNNSSGLQQTIASVISQSFTEIDWIIIDGGSTDGSRDIIRRYTRYFSYWVSEPDRGIYNAMNKGVLRAKGEYCLFLNSGDELCGNNVLSEFLPVLQNREADVIFGNVKLFDGETFIKEIVYPSDLSFTFLLDNSICHNSSFIKTNQLKRMLYSEDYSIVSDQELFIKFALQGLSFFHVNKFVVNYDLNGMSSKNEDLLLKERKKMFEKIIPPMVLTQYYKDKLNYDGQLRQIDYYRSKRALFHKMITINILIMKLVNKWLR